MAIKWSGSLAAQREYEEALRAKPPQPKKRKRRKRQPPAAPQFSTYQEYLNSPWWKHRREQAKKNAGYKCERCSAKGRLEVHHRHYKTLGREKRADLEVLCGSCHDRCHECVIAANEHLASIARRVG